MNCPQYSSGQLPPRANERLSQCQLYQWRGEVPTPQLVAFFLGPLGFWVGREDGRAGRTSWLSCRMGSDLHLVGIQLRGPAIKLCIGGCLGKLAAKALQD